MLADGNNLPYEQTYQPTSPDARNIDIWWIVHDGGLMLLLASLFQRHAVWRRSNIRLFLLRSEEDESSPQEIHDQVTTYLHTVRIIAQVCQRLWHHRYRGSGIHWSRRFM